MEYINREKARGAEIVDAINRCLETQKITLGQFAKIVKIPENKLIIYMDDCVFPLYAAISIMKAGFFDFADVFLGMCSELNGLIFEGSRATEYMRKIISLKTGMVDCYMERDQMTQQKFSAIWNAVDESLKKCAKPALRDELLDKLDEIEKMEPSYFSAFDKYSELLEKETELRESAAKNGVWLW